MWPVASLKVGTSTYLIRLGGMIRCPLIWLHILAFSGLECCSSPWYEWKLFVDFGCGWLIPFFARVSSFLLIECSNMAVKPLEMNFPTVISQAWRAFLWAPQEAHIRVSLATSVWITACSWNKKSPRGVCGASLQLFHCHNCCTVHQPWLNCLIIKQEPHEVMFLDHIPKLEAWHLSIRAERGSVSPVEWIG